jgi:hypothetical protein
MVVGGSIIWPGREHVLEVELPKCVFCGKDTVKWFKAGSSDEVFPGEIDGPLQDGREDPMPKTP